VVTSLRLADLLASVSLVSDLGFALPPGESMRSGIIATALARRLGLAEADVGDVYYTTLLQHLGCIGYAHETAEVYGDELRMNAAAARAEDGDLGDLIDNFLRAAARGRGPIDFARVTAYTILRGTAFGQGFAAVRCEVGSETARRLGLSSGVRQALYDVAEAWNGRGGAWGRGGEDIAMAARIAAVAATASRFDAIGGPGAAVAALRRRAGGSLDPGVAAAFVDGAAEILGQVHAADPRDTLLAIEPTPVRSVRIPELTRAAAAIADVVDLKSTYTLGHSAGVAELAVAAAARLGLGATATTRLHVAALLHDVGRVGIPDAIWERRGPLTMADREQVRLHAYHSERILARSDVLGPMAAIAGRHHERLDGSGYHRGAVARDLSLEARILAAADAFQAMTQDRAHRAAIPPERTARLVELEVRAGRLDGDAVRAVIDAAGLGRPGRVRVERPASLSDREVEVLRLLARGLSNRDIARRLVVSPRTAEHHVQHIYTKIGVSSRAAAALFAMEHDLLD
jgi:HD-GYP domain-containing protein (c-di-GMP phosphodiesterase class II)